MAITKILARKGRLDVGVRYVLNGDKTQEQVLTARLNCDPGHECRQMLETKRAVGKEGGIQLKQRTVLNVRRKRRRALYTALADAEALAPVKELYEAGLSGMETEFAQYMDAVAALEQCGVPREGLIQEKAELYERLAELNRQIRAERRKLALCRKIQNSLPQMEQEIDKAEAREREVRTNEHRRR